MSLPNQEPITDAVHDNKDPKQAFYISIPLAHLITDERTICRVDHDVTTTLINNLIFINLRFIHSLLTKRCSLMDL